MGFEFVSDFELRISILDSPFGIRHLEFEIPSAAPRQFSLWFRPKPRWVFRGCLLFFGWDYAALGVPRWLLAL